MAPINHAVQQQVHVKLWSAAGEGFSVGLIAIMSSWSDDVIFTLLVFKLYSPIARLLRSSLNCEAKLVYDAKLKYW